MDNYFGIPVMGWHTAFVDDDEQLRYYHNDCIPAEAAKGDHPVAPLIDGGDEWEWEPVCDVCHLPILVPLSQNALENMSLIPTGE